MKRLVSTALVTIATMFLALTLTGCDVDVEEDGPIEDAVEEVED